jgi:predicted nucleic acid-binding protein
MRVVDSSAWAEWLSGSKTGAAVASHLPETGAWIVPTIVQLELAKWVRREFGEAQAERTLAFSMTCQVVSLDTHLAFAAAEACRIHKLATADAIIYATAQHHGADLLTCDAHFKDLAGVHYIPKLKS